jgi:hypothetical protein
MWCKSFGPKFGTRTAMRATSATSGADIKVEQAFSLFVGFSCPPCPMDAELESLSRVWANQKKDLIERGTLDEFDKRLRREWANEQALSKTSTRLIGASIER